MSQSGLLTCLCLLAAIVFPICAGAAPPRRAHPHAASRFVLPEPLRLKSFSLASVYTVTVNSGTAVNHFNPVTDLGACVDAEPAGASPAIYDKTDVAAMLQAGFGSITYRLYGELGVECWHWNPTGKWSGPANTGYFVGANLPSSTPILDTSLYGLEHRGFTNDQANDEDCSRLTDGDLTTYWKSNPYLAKPMTGEPDSAHPQWVVADLGTERSVNAVKIQWANPYATVYEVQYWTGDDAIGDPANGTWKTFPGGSVIGAKGGTVTLTLSSSLIKAEFLRILMSASSYTYDSHGSADPRNAYGYAIYEIGIGTIDSQGKFHDLVVHSEDNTKQTVTYVSSVDPWHGTDYELTDTEQPGIDRVFRSGLIRDIPAIVPVGVLYNTPENAAAELNYILKQGYPVRCVEMGEEPDGQYITPEDYGALYIQFARALRSVHPTIKLGGPIFSEGVDDVAAWPNASGNTSWLNRFLAYLKAQNALYMLQFMSFEHYPADPTANAWQSLLQEPAWIQGALQHWRNDGLPAGTPIYVTEFNFTWDYANAPMELVGALWHADMIGAFLAAGGQAAYFYQAEPLPLEYSGGSGQWGAFPLTVSNDEYAVRYRTSQFFSMSVLCTEWAQPVNITHQVYAATVQAAGGADTDVISAYAVRRPDGQWAVMLINKDSTAPHTVKIQFSGTGLHGFVQQVHNVVLGSKQYVWHNDGGNGSASPDGPVSDTTLQTTSSTEFTLPAGSLTVIRGNVQ